MTPKQLLLTALRGQSAGRILYCPYMAHWRELDAKDTSFQNRLEIIESIGADPLIRGGNRLFIGQHQRVQFIALQDTPTRKSYRYRTPAGDLQFTYLFVPGANTWFLTERPVKELRDLEAVQYIYDDLSVIPDPEIYEICAGTTGHRGLLVPETGVIRPQSSFQSLMDFWVGTIELRYMLQDAPGIVENTLAIMRQRNMEAIWAANQTSAEAIITFENTSSANLSPALFRSQVLPELQNWANALHQHGKILICHTGTPIMELIPSFASSGIDVLESISFSPGSETTIKAMRTALAGGITLLAGIEPIAFDRMSESRLEQYARQLLNEMPPAGCILSSADATSPHCALPKLKLLVKVVSEHNV